ncbi:MAG: flagellar biosynthesis anti-sigma factor FlgM [Dechloromonas sp.]|jgi:negative regulator of flagellin synthesis FlgM|nr:flagellar biosynthesis anti-sigma factor FlgM [Dechloromonas sp.]
MITMKIDNSYKPTTTGIPSKPSTTPTAVPTPAQDAVSLSQVAGSLNAGANQPPVNTARIQEIKQAISEGRFKINPEAIADRLIESTRDLLNRDGKLQA